MEAPPRPPLRAPIKTCRILSILRVTVAPEPRNVDISVPFHGFPQISTISTAILKIPDIIHVLEPQTRQSPLETINIPIGLLMVSRGRPGRAGFHPNMQFLVIFHEVPLENKKISETTIVSPPFGEMGALPRPPLRTPIKTCRILSILGGHCLAKPRNGNSLEHFHGFPPIFIIFMTILQNPDFFRF